MIQVGSELVGAWNGVLLLIFTLKRLLLLALLQCSFLRGQERSGFRYTSLSTIKNVRMEGV